MLLSQQEKHILSRALRFFLYFFGVLFFIIFIDKIAHIFHENTFEEWGIVENIQILLLTTAGLCFLWEAYFIKSYRPLFFFFTSLCCLAICRELDTFWRALFPVVKWRFVLIFPLLALYYLWKKRKSIRQNFFIFLQSPAFYIMFFALVISLPIAQRLGHRPFIRAVLGTDDYSILIRRTFEECTESIGYLLLIFSAIECYFDFRNKKS